MPDAPTPIEPGWYPDPKGRKGMELYWDGEKWTGAPRERPPGLTSSGVLLIVAGTIIGTIVVGLIVNNLYS
jgi:hypothetical protein